jgi:MoaA/NifB/PqqE/SkfB family radical SAM enzyme
MIGSNWEESIQNVKTLIAARDAEAEKGGNRCQITLQVTFMTENVKELPEIVNLAIQLGVDRIKGHHLWVHFKEMEALSLRQNKETIRTWNKTVKDIKNLVSEKKLPNGKTLKLDNIFPLDENNIEDLIPGGECPFLGKEAWINTEGRFDPCCAPDKMRQTLGYFGSVRDKKLMEIWNGEAYKTLKNTYHQRELCKKCNMRKPTT